MKKDRKKRCMIFIISLGLLLTIMGHGYAGLKPKLIVLPFIPEQGCQYDGTGLAVQNLLENVLPLHTGLEELWFNWKIKKIFPDMEKYTAYYKGKGDQPDMNKLGKELGIRYWVYGSVISRSDGGPGQNEA